MIKRTVCMIVILVLLLAVSLPVYADAGPKPQLTVNAVNMPGSECYMDLLVESDKPGTAEEEFLSLEYNQDMVNAISLYHDGGWAAGVTNGLFMTFDDIRCRVADGECVKYFGYRPPDKFKIIVVDENGGVVVSNVVERKLFDSTVDFDYETGVAAERSMFPSIAFQFMITFITTFAIEALIFLAFRFSFKKYWGLLLGVNLGTQVLLHAVIGWGMFIGGLFIALIFYVLAEFVIFLIEGFVYGFTLRQHPVGRRIGYAVTANAISAVTGFILAIIVGLA